MGEGGSGDHQATANRATRRLATKEKFPNHPINDWAKANELINLEAPQLKEPAGPAKTQGPASRRAAGKGRQPATARGGGTPHAAFKNTRTHTSGKSVKAKTAGIQRTCITNAGNTCYISSVLFYLFSTISSRDKWLALSQGEGAGANNLRSTIWDNFVVPVRQGVCSNEAQHVSRQAMLKIREECRKLGWQGGAVNTEQQDPEEFFNWLHGTLGDVHIVLTRNILSESGVKEPNPSSDLYSSLSLPLWHPESGEAYPESARDLESLLQKFMNENPVCFEGQQRSIVYSFADQPDIIDLHLKRYNYKSGETVKTSMEVKLPMLLTLHNPWGPEGLAMETQSSGLTSGRVGQDRALCRHVTGGDPGQGSLAALGRLPTPKFWGIGISPY